MILESERTFIVLTVHIWWV